MALREDDGLYWLEGDPFTERARWIEVVGLAGVSFLAPCATAKIVAVGLNYLSHAKEVGTSVPREPLFFLKPPSAVLAHGGRRVYPTDVSQRVAYEEKLAVAMGRWAKDVSPEEAVGHVLGYTCANDVTARDLPRGEGQWTRAEGLDTFCPLGPVISTDVDPGDVTIRTPLNGVVQQNGSTSEMIFPVEELISNISAVMTLETGDVILTGTPTGVGELKPGDRAGVEIQGIGTLTNSVTSG